MTHALQVKVCSAWHSPELLQGNLLPQHALVPDEEGGAAPSAVVLSLTDKADKQPLELWCTGRGLQGANQLLVTSTARNVEVSLQGPGDPEPSYMGTFRATSSDSGQGLTALIDIKPCMGTAAVRLRLLSLQQPGTCSIYSIGVQCSRKGQGVHSAMTSSAAPSVISGTSIRSSSTSTYATGGNSTAPQVPRFSSVDGEHASKHAEAAETAVPSPSANARPLTSGAGTSSGQLPAAEGTPASQMEQIRLLLQHAVMLGGTGDASTPSPPIPASLDMLMSHVQATHSKAGPSFQALASSVATRALQESAQARQRPHQQQQQQQAATHPPAGASGMSPPLAVDAQAQASQASGLDASSSGPAPSWAASPSSLLMTVSSSLAELHRGLGRVEALEVTLGQRVAQLDALCGQVVALQQRMEARLQSLDMVLGALGCRRDHLGSEQPQLTK